MSECFERTGSVVLKPFQNVLRFRVLVQKDKLSARGKGKDCGILFVGSVDCMFCSSLVEKPFDSVIRVI